MYAIQPINKFYITNRYVGLYKNNLPYLVYEGNEDFPQAIHGFYRLDSAIKYLTNFINRTEIRNLKLTTAEVVDIALVNNANKFQIVKYHIDGNEMKIDEIFPQPQFTRKEWY